MPGETLTSYASRLSACNRVPLLRFCQDLGVDGKRLPRGDDGAIARLSELSGEPSEALARAAVRRTGPSRHSVNGQALQRTDMRRLELVACPLCLADDVAARELPPDELAYGRLSWSLTLVDACPIHGVALEILDGKRGHDLASHDFAGRVAPFLPRLGELAARARTRRPTALQDYVLRRLAGEDGGAAWLDAQPLFAAAAACERVGVAATVGPDVPLSRLTREDWRLAGQAGYGLLSLGPTGLDELCVGLVDRRRRRASSVVGPQAIFGSLWVWLDRGNKDPALDPLRAALAERIFDNLPLPTGARILGHVLERRRWHSLASAAAESGRSAYNTRALLAAAGVLPAGHEDRLPWQVTFDAAAAAPHLTPQRELLGAADVMAELGVGHAVVTDLQRNGLLARVPGAKKRRSGRFQFERSALSTFTHALFAGAADVASSGAGEFDVVKCAAKARCSVASVVALVLDGGLSWRGRLVGATGLRGLLLRYAEVRESLKGNRAAALPLERIFNDLRMPRTHVVNLMADGLLPTREVARPGRLRPLRVVTREDLAAFEAEYVSLGNIVRETGASRRDVSRRLHEAGVKPALPRDRFGSIYRRSELPSFDGMPRAVGATSARRRRVSHPEMPNNALGRKIGGHPLFEGVRRRRRRPREVAGDGKSDPIASFGTDHQMGRGEEPDA